MAEGVGVKVGLNLGALGSESYAWTMPCSMTLQSVLLVCALCNLSLKLLGVLVFIFLNVAEKKSKLLAQKTFDIPGSLRKLNQSQNKAILDALRKPFTLIQGPPGETRGGTCMRVYG